MTRKRMNIVGILIVAAISFVAGYWPQHQRYLNAVGDLRFADHQLNEAMGRERIYYLENMLLQALDRAAHKEYKEAQALATGFFLEVRADIARPDMTKFTPGLKNILEKSDGITEALNKKEDQVAQDMMRGVMQQLARMAGPPPTTSEPPAVISVTPTPQS